MCTHAVVGVCGSALGDCGCLGGCLWVSVGVCGCLCVFPWPGDADTYVTNGFAGFELCFKISFFLHLNQVASSNINTSSANEKHHV